MDAHKIATLGAGAAVLFAAIGSAQAAQTHPLTARQAATAIRADARGGLSSLLSVSVGSAPTRVGQCSTDGRRGRCAVVVHGTTQTCRYTGHVLKVGAGGFMVWGTAVRCGN